MNIAIDLSPLQGPHRMRGIGYTVINFFNAISEADRKNNHYILFVLPVTEQTPSPLDFLDLSDIKYELRELTKKKHFRLRLPNKLRHINGLLSALQKMTIVYHGDSRISSLKGIDVFLQCDQSQPLPRRRRGTKIALIAYDIIPYVLEWDYLWDYKTALRKGYSWRGGLRCKARRWLYIHSLRVNMKRASTVFAISESTAHDFRKYVSRRRNNIIVTPLGVPDKTIEGAPNKPSLRQYISTSWGYLPSVLALDDSAKYLLFVGGADSRRKLEDLVTAFNRLRAQGHEIKLVLAGDSMQGPNNISTKVIQRALKHSSYLEDIIFMGFVNDETREWLYSHALAFVFPSRYEGFGLPVLEAMRYGTPVISYRNAATEEVALEYPIYADSPKDIESATLELLQQGATIKNRKACVRHSLTYTWTRTASAILSALN